MKSISLILLSLLLIFASGCMPKIPPEALQLQKESLALKQLQTRRFDGIKENDILAACSGVIQDLGFSLEESETDLGLIVASKDRNATDAGDVLLVLLLVGLTGSADVAYDDKQNIRISLVTRPVSEDSADKYYVRVTFQRIVWNNKGQISRLESIEDDEVYQEFFDKLSKSIFLEGQKI